MKEKRKPQKKGNFANLVHVLLDGFLSYTKYIFNICNEINIILVINQFSYLFQFEVSLTIIENTIAKKKTIHSLYQTALHAVTRMFSGDELAGKKLFILVIFVVNN